MPNLDQLSEDIAESVWIARQTGRHAAAVVKQKLIEAYGPEQAAEHPVIYVRPDDTVAGTEGGVTVELVPDASTDPDADKLPVVEFGTDGVTAEQQKEATTEESH